MIEDDQVRGWSNEKEKAQARQGGLVADRPSAWQTQRPTEGHEHPHLGKPLQSALVIERKKRKMNSLYYFNEKTLLV